MGINKLWIIPIIILFLVSFVYAEPLLIKKLSFPDASTTSSSFVSIGTSNLIINKTTDVNIIIELEAELSGGGVQEDRIADYRILVDSVEIVARNRLLRAETQPLSISIIGNINLDSGIHIVDLQHKISGGTVTSREITATVITNTLANTSLLHTDSFEFGLRLTDVFPVSGFRTIGVGTFNTTSPSDIITFLNLNVTQSHAFFDGENADTFIVRYEFDDEVAGILEIQSDSPQQIYDKLLYGSSFIFENVSVGTHNWNVSGRHITIDINSTITAEITFIEDSIDQLNVSESKILISQDIQINNTFTTIANISLTVSDFSDIYAIASGTIESLVLTFGSSDVLEIKLRLDNGTETEVRNVFVSPRVTEEPSQETFFITGLFEDIPASTASVSVLARATTSNLTIRNLSFIIIEVNDYDTNIQIPNSIPQVTLESPADSSVLNGIDFIEVDAVCSATDDDSISDLANITYFDNSTGIFSARETNLVSGDADETTFIRTFTTEEAILWTCQVEDTLNAKAFSPVNRTYFTTITAGTPQMLATELTYADASTSSSTFTSIGSDTFIINKTTDATIIISLNAILVNSGGATTFPFFAHKMEVDGIDIIQQRGFHEFIGDNSSVVLMGTVENLALGSHTVEIFHRTNSETILSKDIQAIVLTNTIENSTILNTQVLKIPAFRIDTSIVVDFVILNTTITIDDTRDLITFMTINYTNEDSAFAGGGHINFSVTLDSEKSGNAKNTIAGLAFDERPRATDIGFVWVFENISSGIHDVLVTTTMNVNCGAQICNVTGNGEINFMEVQPEIVTYNFTHISGITIPPTNETVNIANLTITIKNSSSIYVFAPYSPTTTTNSQFITSNSFIELVGVANTTHRAEEHELGFGAGTNRDARQIVNTALFKNLEQGTYEIKLHHNSITSATTNTPIEAISIFAIEVRDYDTDLEIPDNVPIVTLVSPANDSNASVVPSVDNVTFTCLATDDNGINQVTFFWNITGTFIADETGTFSSETNVNFTVNHTFMQSEVILWNCEATDTNSQKSFASNNFTVNIQALDVTPPNVTLILPLNETFVSTRVSFTQIFTYNVTDGAVDMRNCSLRFNNIINLTSTSISITETNQFEFTFITNTSVNWSISCFDVVGNEGFSGFRILEIEILDKLINQLFSVVNCPDTVGEAILLILFSLIAIFFILMGIATRIGFVGFFGAILLMIVSLFIAPCINIFGTALALLSMLLLFYFIFRGSFANIQDAHR